MVIRKGVLKGLKPDRGVLKGLKSNGSIKCYNLCHNLSMWRVVVGGGMSPYGPTITPPLATTRHMGKL